MLELYKPAIRQGAILAIINILIFLLQYAIDPFFYAKPSGWIVAIGVNMLALPILFLILGSKGCKPNFSPYTFGNAFNAAFFTGIVATVILLIFNIIFVTVIDTAWEAEMAEEVLNSTEAFMEKMGAPQEAIDKAMDDARTKQVDKPKGIMGQIQSAGMSLAWYALLSLIIGAVQRTKKTEMDEISELGN